MTRPDVEAIRRRVDAATPGKWWWLRHNYEHDGPCQCARNIWERENPGKVFDPNDDYLPSLGGHDCLMAETANVGISSDASGYSSSFTMSDPDREMIASSRTDLPALLDYIDWLEASLRNIAAHGGAWEKQKALDALKGRP